MKPPISPDVARVIGEYAERIENRSLLLDKFVAHKAWPQPLSVRGKWDEASRWSMLRITENADTLFQKDEAQLRHDSENRNGRVTPEKQEKATALIPILAKMRQCACRKLPDDLESIRQARVKHIEELLSRDPSQRRVATGRLEARLALNLSDGLIQNAGICLDRMFGNPYIPGSAVKGVCRHVALARLRAGTMSFDMFQSIFGTADSDFKRGGEGKKGGELADFAGQAKEQNRKGCIVFLAAYPKTPTKIVVDLTNVHFPQYYESGEQRALAEETPKPNPFPVVDKGAEYVFCIASNGMITDGNVLKTILDTAFGILHDAIEQVGIGAKTAAGYGWFSDLTAEKEREEAEKAAENKRKEEEEIARKAEEDAARAAEAARLASMTPEAREAEEIENAKSGILVLEGESLMNYAKALDSKSVAEKKAFSIVFRTDKDKKDRWKTWKKKKPEIAEKIRAILKTIGEDLP